MLKVDNWRNKTDIVSGVYIILCSASDSAYVGQSIDLWRRLYDHRYKLRSNKHPNTHMQNAWNRYGESRFLAKIIHVEDIDRLTIHEQFLFNLVRNSGLSTYNFREFVDSNRGTKQSKETISARIEGFIKDWKAISPAGDIVYIHNLAEFCRKNRLSHEGMRGVLIGKKRSYKGWTSTKEYTPSKKYPFRSVVATDIDGNTLHFSSIKEASRKTGVLESGIVSTARGKRHTAGRYQWEYCDE